MAKKKSRYATKVELGLVPHVYDRSRKGYGTVVAGAPIHRAKREPLARRGRHVFVNTQGTVNPE